MATIFHLALTSDWEAAKAAGTYTISTRGRTLAQEGFIHASRGDQWPGVRERFYADVTEPMVLLGIDTDLLGVPVVEEPAVPGGAETFPHIYGPLPVAAVTRVIALDSPAGAGRSTATSAAPAPDAPSASAVPATPQRDPSATKDPSFTEVYFKEMFRNACLILLVIGLGLIGGLIGDACSTYGGEGHDWPALVGALAGLTIGGTVAVRLYRRSGERAA